MLTVKKYTSKVLPLCHDAGPAASGRLPGSHAAARGGAWAGRAVRLEGTEGAQGMGGRK